MNTRKVLVPAVLFVAFALLALTATPSPKAFAQSACSAQNCVFIPVVVTQPAGPQLLYPAPNEALTILAPVFRWSTPLIGRYRIQVSEDATFATITDLDTTIRVRDAAQQQAERVANSNLDARKTYYWRVGIETPLDSGNYAFTETRSLTTPQRKETTLLAAIPTQISPTANQVLPPTTTDITVVWDQVPGALYYRINLDIGDGTRLDSELIPGTQTSYTFVGIGIKGNNYSWEIKAVNSYGWSDFSTPIRFRIKAN